MSAVRSRHPPPYFICFLFAGIAQLVEHLTCNEDVAGSSPVSSSIGELAQLGEHLPCTQGVNGSIPLFSTKHSWIAQLVEQSAVNRSVVGSSPTPGAIYYAGIAQR